ncbi:MAG: glycosyltransferase family 2 protein [Nitrospinae bacterium]|nr:glycosyltransferase family 2 protein [Nitrospinota bacterium]
MNFPIPDLSVVVLCYRSADTIASFVESLSVSLDRDAPNWELVLVGNYFENSGDRTPQVVTDLAKTDPRIQAVALVKQGMMGWDLKSGLRAARGRFLTFIDGDGQMPYEDVIRCYKKLKGENLDLVKTFRFKRSDGFYRVCISAIYNFLFKLLFPGLKSVDINSKPKIFKREVYEKMDLTSDGWFIDAEIMIQARRLHLKIGEVPTVFYGIDSRPSFIKPLALLEFLGNLIYYRILEFVRHFRDEKKK